MRSLLDAGIPLALGSDGRNNPYLNIMLAPSIRESLTKRLLASKRLLPTRWRRLFPNARARFATQDESE